MIGISHMPITKAGKLNNSFEQVTTTFFRVDSATRQRTALRDPHKPVGEKTLSSRSFALRITD